MKFIFLLIQNPSKNQYNLYYPSHFWHPLLKDSVYTVDISYTRLLKDLGAKTILTQ